MNLGHGHVFPRSDGVKARCGGPMLCGECARDFVRKSHGETGPLDVAAVAHDARVVCPAERMVAIIDGKLGLGWCSRLAMTLEGKP